VSIYATAASTANWGDVVNVYYELYLDSAYSNLKEQGPISNVYLGPGYAVPSYVLEVVPDANAGFLEKFKEGIVGATVNQPKAFKINAADGYANDPTHELYGADLYFRITVTEIVYDASANTTTTTSTTSTTSSKPLIGGVDTLVILGGGALVLLGGFGYWSYRSSRSMRSAMTGERSSSFSRQERITKEKDQLKELRELTDSMRSSEELSEEKEVKFRRRR